MRLPPPDEADLSPTQEAYKQAVAEGRKGLLDDVWRLGPFGVLQHAPEMGLAALPVGTAVRQTSLSVQAREIAILAAGIHHRAKFEFAAHRAIGVAGGLDGEALDRWAAGGDPGFEGENDVARRVASTLVSTSRLPDDLYAEGVATFGETGLVELVSSVGYYCMVSLTLNAFEVPLVDGMTDPWPED